MTALFYILRLNSGNLYIGATKNLEKAKIFNSSPFSLNNNALAFQWGFEGINAYAVSPTDFLMAASFRKAAFLIRSFKISRRYSGSGPPTTISTLEGIPLVFFP
jgi:hypothetical protein